MRTSQVRERGAAAAVHLAEDGTGQELVLQELRGQGVNVDGVEERVQVLSPALHVPADPVCAGLVHLGEDCRRCVNRKPGANVLQSCLVVLRPTSDSQRTFRLS